MSTQRNLSIDLLRGLACLYITAYWHVKDYLNTDEMVFFRYQPWTAHLTQLCLGLFVFLSAYFIGKKRQFSTGKDSLDFFKGRLVRLYPLYLLAIVLFFVCGVVGRRSLGRLLGSSVFISMFTGSPPRTLWFMTMLLVFIFLAPLILGKTKGIARIVGSSAALFLGLLIYSETTTLLDARMLLYLPAFISGLLIGAHEKRLDRPSFRFFLYFATVLCVIFLPLKVGGDVRGYWGLVKFEQRFVNKILLDIPFVTLASTALFFETQRLNQYLQPYQKPILFFGYSSFCMYLFHRPIYAVLIDIYYPESSLLQCLYLLYIGVPIMIGASWGIQRLYDQLLRSFRTQKKESPAS